MQDHSLAVGLLTCGREIYTQTTVDSFRLHNAYRPFHLLHVDDASEGGANCDIAYRAGFDLVARHSRRQGQMAGLRRLLQEAGRRGCEWFVLLENDWETVARWATDTAPTSAECLRLYGARKAREGRRAPTGGTNMATGMMIQWEPAMGGLMEMGEAHWAGPPSAVRTDRLLPRAMECASAKELSRTLSLWTARLVDNAVWHLCEETTPGFIP